MNEHTQAYMVEVVKKFLDGGFDGDKWNYEVHDEIAFVGGIGGLVASMLGAEIWLQLVVFFTVSIVLLSLLFRALCILGVNQ